jgi:RimK family alpha-L-glutamate ligase
MLLILRSKKKIGKKMGKFLQIISKNLDRKKVAHFFSSFEEIELFLDRGKVSLLVAGKPLTEWTTIFPRKVGRHSGLAFILASCARKNKILFLDRFRESTNDITKLVQMFLFSVNKIPIPKTYYSSVYLPKQLGRAIEFLKFPIVIKQCNTSKGEGVSLVRNKKMLQSKLAEITKNDPKKEIILQEFISNDFEYRIFVTGNKIAVAEKKIRTNEEEFRNNVHLGAKEEFLDVNKVKKNIIKVALRAAKVTNVQISGVDIAEDADGNPVVFEVNSCPSFTLDSRISNEVEKLAEYLKECEKK